MVYLNRAEFGRYNSLLEEVSTLLASDLTVICNLLGIEVTPEDLIETYVHNAKGPNVFEQTLINSGDCTRDDIMQNRIFNKVVRKIEYLKAGVDR